MTGRGFTSAFAARLEEYVEFKCSMGFYGASRIWYLKRFDVYCAGHGRSVFDRDTVEGWVTAQLSTSGRYRSWMSYIRDFGRWLRAHGHAGAYVLPDEWKAGFVPAHPYLLTGGEIEAFFAAAALLDTPSPWRWQAVAFFTLMHSCGIRTGEARALLAEHVDLPGRHIDVMWSKGSRSRRLPVSDDVADVLATCDRHVKGKVRPVATDVLRLVRRQTGHRRNGRGDIQPDLGPGRAAAPSGGTRPRPYDFRHHFAYANIERWMAAGIDVAAMLPYLSAYMGHATVESTYYYIHTSPDFMNAYAHITRGSSSVLPEAGFE